MKRVYVESRTVGQAFGCVGIIREIGSGRKLAESEKVRPYGFASAACRDAECIAIERGWELVENLD